MEAKMRRKDLGKKLSRRCIVQKQKSAGRNRIDLICTTMANGPNIILLASFCWPRPIGPFSFVFLFAFRERLANPSRKLLFQMGS